MILLYTDGYDSLKKLIFEFYDFDKDGQISLEDVKVVLSYVPLNISEKHAHGDQMKFEREDFTDRVESQNELQDLLTKCFGEKKLLNYHDFSEVIQNISSEIFLYILIFLFEKRPFSKKSLDEYQSKEEISSSYLCKTQNCIYKTKNLIASPNLNSKFSPSVTLRKSPFWKMKTLSNLKLDDANKKSKHGDFLNKLGINQNNQSGSINMLLKYSKLTPTAKKEEKNLINMQETMDSDRSQYCDYENIVEENFNSISIPIFSKHRNNLNQNNKKNSSKEFETVDIEPAVKFKRNLINFPGVKKLEKLDKPNNNPLFNFNCIVDESDEDLEDLNHKGYLYRISNKGKMKKIYFKLIQRDLYHFIKPTDLYHKGMTNLSGVFIQEDGELYLAGKRYYSFVLIFNLKKRVYYTENEEDYKKWVSSIKFVTGYKDLNETYLIKEKLGNGRFGLVRLGIQISTGRKVAIKIMFKLNMTLQDLQMVRTEIEILKVCQHPNIIKIYDVYENANYIYISKEFLKLVMEYCSGGDLFSYLEKRNFKLPENKAADIIHKLATAIFYIQSYGITHRDLKPENILMTDLTNESDIRLVDFGLSKIIGPDETCNEPFGTLSYVAPEVLLELPYNKMVDIWSLGVITYLLLSGCLPFDDDHSEREVARKTIYEDVTFPRHIWKSISLEAKDFVKSKLNLE